VAVSAVVTADCPYLRMVWIGLYGLIVALIIATKDASELCALGMN